MLSKTLPLWHSPRPVQSAVAVFGLTACLLWSMTLGAGHPYHVCVGEMDWNADRGCWEVALRLHPSDLQTAISQLAGRRLELDGSQEAEKFVLQYLSQHFGWIGLDADQRPWPLPRERAEREPQLDLGNDSVAAERPAGEGPLAELHWLGSELEKGWMWLYFELAPPPKLSGEAKPGADSPSPGRPLRLGLQHSLLLDLVEDQTNTLVVRTGAQRQTLRFTAERRQREMPSWLESLEGPES